MKTNYQHVQSTNKETESISSFRILAIGNWYAAGA
jgi:hypothetical protein